MLLAIDTSTSAIGAAVHDGQRVLAEVVREDARRHGELLAPAVVAVLQQAGVDRRDLTRVVCGVGPGPFTGLRVGVVTALVLAHSLDLPAPDGICSPDALAHAVVGRHEGELLVATDARRKEVYLARYAVSDGRALRQTGPDVVRPADIPEPVRGLPAVGRGAVLYPEVLTRPVLPLDASAGALAEVALQQLADGVEVGLDALYLRRPDAQPSVTAKSTIMAPRDERS